MTTLLILSRLRALRADARKEVSDSRARVCGVDTEETREAHKRIEVLETATEHVEAAIKVLEEA